MSKRNIVIGIIGIIAVSILILVLVFNNPEKPINNNDISEKQDDIPQNENEEFILTTDGENFIVEIPNIIINNNSNSYRIISIVDQQLAEFYFYRFKSVLRSDLPRAKSLVNNIGDLGDLTEYFQKPIKSYKIDGRDGNYRLSIVDTDDWEYVFDIKAVNQYTLNIYADEI